MRRGRNLRSLSQRSVSHRSVSQRSVSHRAAAIVAALTLTAACTSGGDEGTPSPAASSAPAGGAATTTGTGANPTQPAGPGTGSRWDIDAALAADPNCANPVQGDPLVIGYAADLGVIGGFADAPASEMAKHLAKLINCSGGFAGRSVRVDVADISGSPTDTRAAVLNLIRGGAQVLLGPPFPDPGLRVLQATQGRMAVIFTGSTEPALADATDLSYLVAFNDTQGASAAAQFAQSRGWKTAVTLSSPGPYFGYNVRVFTAAFTANGGQVLADLPFVPAEQTDFADAVATIAQNPPDVIYTPMLAEQLVALKTQL
ncbi:MAG: ABC transporter substrate-binding protein, partial [Acidimicrobiia bacterium]|nr:ABC transporter substrate-binding protein [Acidimicrobiia bacterium]